MFSSFSSKLSTFRNIRRCGHNSFCHWCCQVLVVDNDKIIMSFFSSHLIFNIITRPHFYNLRNAQIKNEKHTTHLLIYQVNFILSSNIFSKNWSNFLKAEQKSYNTGMSTICTASVCPKSAMFIMPSLDYPHPQPIVSLASVTCVVGFKPLVALLMTDHSWYNCSFTVVRRHRNTNPVSSIVFPVLYIVEWSLRPASIWWILSSGLLAEGSQSN